MTEPIKILLIDDDEEDFIITRDIIKDIPQRKYNIQWAGTFTRAMELIDQKAHDIYLVDYRLGGETGLDLIKTVIKNGCNAPIILLTGQGDLEIDEQAMEAGASDYLIKGKINPHDLDRSIRYSIQNFKHIKEIQKLNSELEQRVQQRTSELFNAIKELEATNKKQQQAEIEVRKALNKEKELNELKSRFVTIASHEFRTPLTTILSAASLILKYNEKRDHEKIATNIHRIKSSVSNLTLILNDFLSLSKLEEGALINSPIEFNLKDFIEEIKEEIKSVLKEDQELVYRHIGKEIIFLDKQILKNIIINLISNAIKYSEKGIIEISSEVASNSIKISVKDEGIGIPEEDKSFLLNRFFRAKNAGNIQGTGLGLNIVKKYVEHLNGKLDFESQLGKGTIFKIEI